MWWPGTARARNSNVREECDVTVLIEKREKKERPRRWAWLSVKNRGDENHDDDSVHCVR